MYDPLLVTSDGAPGIIKAIEECFPRAARQRLAHRMRNLAIKVPEDVWPEFKVRVQATYQAPSLRTYQFKQSTRFTLRIESQDRQIFNITFPSTL